MAAFDAVADGVCLRLLRIAEMGLQCPDRFHRADRLFLDQAVKIRDLGEDPVPQADECVFLVFVHWLYLMIHCTAAAASAAEGRVTSQVNRISPALPQRTALGRSAAPTPMMPELTTCVVETGPPNIAAPDMTAAAVIWLASPCMGRRR